MKMTEKELHRLSRGELAQMIEQLRGDMAWLERENSILLRALDAADRTAEQQADTQLEDMLQTAIVRLDAVVEKLSAPAAACVLRPGEVVAGRWARLQRTCDELVESREALRRRAAE